jgi:hypothetical protein
MTGGILEALSPDDLRERRATVLLLDASSSGATDGGASGTGLHPESGAGRDHRCLAGVDGGDDLGIVDPLLIRWR